jgi:uncharacterized protein involved in exopolysaccharide biosynthesis
MRGLARILICLYPASWRARYGEEFEALLEDSPITFQSTVDLLKGAIGMHLSVPQFPKLAVILSIAGLAGGLGISFIVPPRYVSQAELRLGPSYVKQGEDVRRNLTEHLVQMENQILSRTSLSNIIQDPRLDLYKDERAHIPLEDVIERMRTQDIHIRIDSLSSEHRDSVAFSISFVHADRLKARQTVQALIVKFQDANLTAQRDSATARRGRTPDQVDRMEQRIAAVEKRLGIGSPPPGRVDFPGVLPAGINLDVLDPPSLPVKPVSPNRAAFMLAGLGAGFLSALLVAIFRRKAPPLPFPAQTA